MPDLSAGRGQTLEGTSRGYMQARINFDARFERRRADRFRPPLNAAACCTALRGYLRRRLRGHERHGVRCASLPDRARKATYRAGLVRDASRGPWELSPGRRARFARYAFKARIARQSPLKRSVRNARHRAARTGGAGSRTVLKVPWRACRSARRVPVSGGARGPCVPRALRFARSRGYSRRYAASCRPR